MATRIYKKRKRKSRKRDNAGKAPGDDMYRRGSARANSRYPQPLERSKALKLAASRIAGFKAMTPELQTRYVNHFRENDASRQRPGMPAYLVPTLANTKSPVRSSSLSKRYFIRRWRGRTLADGCAERPDPAKGGEARQRQIRERRAYGQSGRIPKDVQKARRSRQFKVWCQ